jgi:hypothetical protein
VFGVGIEDSERWTDQQRAAAEACQVGGCTNPINHAAHQISDFMLAAGRTFVEANPEVYRLLV